MCDDIPLIINDNLRHSKLKEFKLLIYDNLEIINDIENETNKIMKIKEEDYSYYVYLINYKDIQNL